MFILATTEAQKIPATILSRCTRFDFKLIPLPDLENRLKYVLKTIGKDYEEEAVAALARAGAGSMRDMLSLADPVRFVFRRETDVCGRDGGTRHGGFFFYGGALRGNFKRRRRRSA